VKRRGEEREGRDLYEVAHRELDDCGGEEGLAEGAVRLHGSVHGNHPLQQPEGLLPQLLAQTEQQVAPQDVQHDGMHLVRRLRLWEEHLQRCTTRREGDVLLRAVGHLCRRVYELPHCPLLPSDRYDKVMRG
jgi:hypothetical protein